MSVAPLILWAQQAVCVPGTTWCAQSDGRGGVRVDLGLQLGTGFVLSPRATLNAMRAMVCLVAALLLACGGESQRSGAQAAGSDTNESAGSSAGSAA